jgi:hypothetical protein
VQKLLNRQVVTLLAVMLEDNQSLLELKNSIIQEFDNGNKLQPFLQENNSSLSDLRELRQKLMAVSDFKIADATLANLLQNNHLKNITSSLGFNNQVSQGLNIVNNDNESENEIFVDNDSQPALNISINSVQKVQAESSEFLSRMI